MKELARMLKENHRFINGCWVTEYSKIPGLRLYASSTSGTSGIGYWKRKRVHWWLNHNTGEFEIEPA